MSKKGRQLKWMVGQTGEASNEVKLIVNQISSCVNLVKWLKPCKFKVKRNG